MEQRRQAMPQLHLSDQQFIAHEGDAYIWDLTVGGAMAYEFWPDLIMWKQHKFLQNSD